MIRLALCLPLLAIALGSCQLRTAADLRAEDARRRETANAAATCYEAAQAIQDGADPEAPAEAIKANAQAITTAQGYAWPPPTPSTPVPKGTP